MESYTWSLKFCQLIKLREYYFRLRTYLSLLSGQKMIMRAVDKYCCNKLWTLWISHYEKNKIKIHLSVFDESALHKNRYLLLFVTGKYDIANDTSTISSTWDFKNFDNKITLSHLYSITILIFDSKIKQIFIAVLCVLKTFRTW